MMRIARVLTLLLAVSFGGAATVRAQATTSAVPSKYYLSVDAGATLGHSSDKFIGAEAGMHWRDMWDFILEGGHIGNAASSDFDDRGTRIANAVGATASSVQKVNFLDLGLRYHSPVGDKWDGYVMFGGGAARVSSETVLSVNGTAVDPAALGVAFGADLNGSVTVGNVVFGAGATRDFYQRYFLDLSYRFGRTFPKSDADGNTIVPGLNTQRLQVGVGVRF